MDGKLNFSSAEARKTWQTAHAGFTGSDGGRAGVTGMAFAAANSGGSVSERVEDVDMVAGR